MAFLLAEAVTTITDQSLVPLGVAGTVFLGAFGALWTVAGYKGRTDRRLEKLEEGFGALKTSGEEADKTHDQRLTDIEKWRIRRDTERKIERRSVRQTPPHGIPLPRDREGSDDDSS